MRQGEKEVYRAGRAAAPPAAPAAGTGAASLLERTVPFHFLIAPLVNPHPFWITGDWLAMVASTLRAVVTGGWMGEGGKGKGRGKEEGREE